jgi:hypothetical protein
MTSILNERYEVIERQLVDEGDFTDVSYKARVLPKSSDFGDGRVVLLRLLPPNSETSTVRAAIDHAASIPPSPNILKLYGITKITGETDIVDGIYLVSEYARGISLRERIRRVAPFSLAVSLDITISICQAILQAEFVGVAHLALKPEYVLLTPEGLVKVQNFQVADAVSTAIGSDTFCRDDRRSIGLLLYEMLTGVAADQLVVADEHSPRQLNANVPPALDGIVRKATSLDLDKQYTDVSRILADLQSAREDLRAGKSLAWSPLGISSGNGQVRSTAKTIGMTKPIVADRVSKKQPLSNEGTDRNTERYDEVGYPIWGRILLSVLGVVVLGLVFAGAYLYTIMSVPTDVVVPNLIGKQFSDAQNIAASDHFNLVKTIEDYSDILPAGYIYQMSPTPGRTIKAGKDVSVSVSDGPRQVVVPDLSDMTVGRATQTLVQSQLPQGPITDTFSDTVAKGVVISQQPSANSSVPHETPVGFVVSKGPAPPVAPTGLTATATVDGEIDLSWNDDTDAVTYNIYRDGVKLQSGLPQAAYSDVNLASGESHSYTVTGVNENGESTQSAPVQGTTITDVPPATTNDTPSPPDSTVPTELTTPTSAPGELKQRRFDIRFRVPDDGPHNCQIEVQDTTGTNIVYDQDRQSGDIVDENVVGFGNKIILRIFLDGKLIRQDTK